MDKEPTSFQWRFWLGGVIFSLGLICPALIPIIALSELSTKWKALLSVALVVGLPEILTLIAVAIVGKAGFVMMKNRFLGIVKQTNNNE
jgi:chromate transport protein ChrA